MSSLLVQALHHQSALVFSICSAQCLPSLQKVLAQNSNLRADTAYSTKKVYKANIGRIHEID